MTDDPVPSAPGLQGGLVENGGKFYELLRPSIDHDIPDFDKTGRKYVDHICKQTRAGWKSRNWTNGSLILDRCLVHNNHLAGSELAIPPCQRTPAAVDFTGRPPLSDLGASVFATQSRDTKRRWDQAWRSDNHSQLVRNRRISAQPSGL